MRGIDPAEYDLFADRLLDQSTGATVAIALVLDHEKVSVETFGNLYKVLVDISGQVLVYDFAEDEKSIIASYRSPSQVYVDHLRQASERSAALQAGRTILVRRTGRHARFAKPLVSTLADAPVKQKFTQELGIGRVRIANPAWEHLPQHLANSDENTAFWIARRFAASLTANQGSRSATDPTARSPTWHYDFASDNLTQMLAYPEPYYELDVDVIDLPRAEKTNSSVQLSLWRPGQHSPERRRPGGFRPRG